MFKKGEIGQTLRKLNQKNSSWQKREDRKTLVKEILKTIGKVLKLMKMRQDLK